MVKIKSAATPYGYYDLAVNAGRYLAITAPQKFFGLQRTFGGNPGNLIVLDLKAMEKAGQFGNNEVPATAFKVVKLASNVSSSPGKGLQTVESGPMTGQFIVSAAHDYNAGVYGVDFAGLRADTPAKSLPEPKISNLKLTPPTTFNAWYNAKHYQNIQRAEEVVVTTVEGTQYAIVADYNFIFNEIGYYDGALARKQVGGKIGIIQDPFGIKGEPRYLGASTPIIGAALQHLNLSPDGMSLASDGLIDEGNRILKALFRWDDVPTLIKAALANADANPSNIRKPFDLQNAALHPTKIVQSDLPLSQGGGRTDIGWVTGIASRGVTDADIDMPARYGDIFKVDLLSIISNLDGPLKGVTANEVEAFYDIDSAGMGKIIEKDDKIVSHELATGNDSAVKIPGETGNYTYRTRKVDETKNADVYDTGIFYIAPTLDEDVLRAGKHLDDSMVTISFSVWARGEEYTYEVKLKLSDFKSADGRKFFGDRDLDNPGYSKFELNSGVGVGETNNLLDVYRVEQRLKYLGFPAISANTSNTVTEFEVDGKFIAEEAAALKLFEKDVRYKSESATGTGASGGVTVEIQYRASITSTQDTAKLEVVAGSFKVVSAPANITSQAMATAMTAAKGLAIKDAQAKALKAAGFKDASDINGMDGKIEGNVSDTQRTTTLSWLNAYNAPHWMLFNDSFADGGKLTGWINKQGTTASSMGTSWVYDLMISSRIAAVAQNRSTPMWFKGTGDLGVQLNLGINTDYISQENQDKVNSKDIILGLVPTVPSNTTPNAGAYTNKTWDYANTVALSGQLLNPNNSKVTPETNEYGQNQQNQALLDFVAVYSSMQNEPAYNSGSWEEQLSQIRSATGDQQKIIQKALFGDGSQKNGLINSEFLQLGGVALSVGSQMTAESLGLLMGNVPGVNYAAWVEPFQKAFARFNINTPQQIAALFPQVEAETGGLKFLIEDPLKYSAERLREPSLFGTRFTELSGHTDAAGVQLDWAAYLAIPANSTLSNADRARLIANKQYGHAGNVLGNVVDTDDGWNFRGRGPFHLTGRNNYTAFARDTFGVGSATYNQITTDPSFMDTDLDMLALTAASFWSSHNKITYAGALDESNTNPPNIYYTGPNDPVHYETKSPAHPTIHYGAGNLYTDTITKGPNGNAIATDKNSFMRRWVSWQSNVRFVYGTGIPSNSGNPFESMRDVLNRLGISSTNSIGYQNQFGIALHVQKPVPIGGGTQKLMAVSPQAGDTVPLSTVLNETMQSLLTEATNTLGFNEGEPIMFIADIPNAPPSTPVIVMVAQANTSQQTSAQREHVLGVCDVVNVNGTGQVRASPVIYANAYFRTHDATINPGTAKVSILQQPKHGSLEPNSRGDWWDAKYIPNDGYLGSDSFVMQVEGSGHTVTLKYFIAVTDDWDVSANPNPICKGPIWKISLDANGNQVLTAVDSVTTQSDAINAMWNTQFGANGNVTLSFADLVGGAIGQATGTNITLDDNAAGHGWFIDASPLDNSEFLPTSNPYEWVAKEGSAAYGKMDMLSVLLHEYGHALGIEHSADGHDYMATTLTAGVRRLPSAEELALMQQLVGEVKVEMASVSTQGSGNTPSQLPLLPLGGFGLAFLGRLRGTRYGSLNVEADLSTLVTQYAVTANAKLTNGNFSVASGMPVDNGWATQGSVEFVGGAATLKETSTSQTRLNQVFVVNPRDRFLSFTIAGSVLDDVNGAPDDAFEVALLDANTGLSLAGALLLTRTDAMLNIQANGTETAASGVTRVTNADGSGTLTVGVASFTYTATTAGTQSITAVYAGDGNNASSTSTASALTVNKVDSITSLNVTPNPVKPLEPITMTATVTGSNPTGSVNFMAGLTLLGTSPVNAGVATLNTSFTDAGMRPVTAVYSGDPVNTGSNSILVELNVNQVSSTTGLSITPNPAKPLEPITMTATVTGFNPTGTVNFMAGLTLLGTSPVNAGVATLSTSFTDAGMRPVTAVYSGDPVNTGSNSILVELNVNQVSSTTGLSITPNPAKPLEPITMTATVIGSNPTGTVNFMAGLTLLGTSPVNAGVATLSTSFTDAGMRPVAAVYSGDPVNTSSHSIVVELNVNKVASTTTLSVTPNPARPGEPVTMTATVTGFNPTGVVSFMKGGFVIGGATVNGGVATFSTSFPAAGSYVITALYGADTVNEASYSAPVVITINTGVAQAYFIHSDHLNTPRSITDPSGTVVWQWDNSDPFGNNMPNENPNNAGTFNFNLRFAGQYFDRETNTHQNINRDYDPSIGRYVESDPIGLEGGINTYTYVEGNPLSYVDPDGLLFMTTIDGLQRGTTLDDALTHGAPGNAAALAGAASAAACVAAGAYSRVPPPFKRMIGVVKGISHDALPPPAPPQPVIPPPPAIVRPGIVPPPPKLY